MTVHAVKSTEIGMKVGNKIRYLMPILYILPVMLGAALLSPRKEEKP